MRPPPLLLGAALLFWGWRIDLLWAGALCGALVELPHAVKGRWDFSDKEFNRLWDVCTIIFLGIAVYLRYSEELTTGAYKFFQWLPLVFFLMALGFVFSTRDTVPMKAFSWFLRRKKSERADRGIAFGWIYFLTCLVASGASNEQGNGFFFGVAALGGWALWSVRPKRLPDPAWCTLFAIVVGSSFLLQQRAQDLQSFLEMKASEVLVFFGHREVDPNISRTAMGTVGRLKQSSRIAMKVTGETGHFPERLREAALYRFEGTTWRGYARGLDPVAVEADTTTWNLITNVQPTASVRIVKRAPHRADFLALPPGTVQLRELASAEVKTNRFGTVQVSQNPGLLNFVALHTGEFLDPPPRVEDEDYSSEAAALETVAKELKIDELSDEKKVAAILNFFQEKFRYTTYLEANERDLNRGSPLSEFLLKTRAGHCEYFATATVLLLRYFDIPARYAVGYALQQTEKEGDACVVRERDGHAWAMAWVNDRWIEVDSTPADWSRQEKEQFPFYQKLKDAFGRFTFGFLEWRWLGDWGFFRIAAPWLIAPLIGFLAWRIFGRKMSKRQRPIRETQAWPGADSEFYALEAKLARAGLARQDGESVEGWSARMRAEAPALADVIRGIVSLHTRYRFDPTGLENGERERLREMVRDCSARL